MFVALYLALFKIVALLLYDVPKFELRTEIDFNFLLFIYLYIIFICIIAIWREFTNNLLEKCSVLTHL